jgi:AcrR family transcriptional regulator
MTRNYDASRRVEAANRTRAEILAAAFKLHGQGVLDLDSLAREANVSVATVRKHFPNRELLFEGCTGYAMHTIALPDLTAITAVANPEERTRRAVAEVCRALEALLGQIWGAYKLEGESAVMAGVLRQAEGLCAAAAGLVFDAWLVCESCAPQLRGFVTGLLSPLGYRALRVAGPLPPEAAVAQLSAAVIRALQSCCEAEKAGDAYRQ